MVVLYEHPLSPYVHKVKIALGEKGVAFEARLPDFISGQDADFADASPRLEVPALVDGETTIFDSTIILEYIEDRWPTPALLPTTPASRARVRMLEELCDTYYEAINWAGFEVRVFQRAQGDLAAHLMARGSEQIAGVNAYLDRQLGDAPYFNGAAFGWGDLCVVPAVHAAALSDNPPAPGSGLARWLERVRARPSVAKTFQQAAESMAGFEMIPELIKSGMFKRQYRDHRLEWMVRSGGLDIVLDGLRQGNIRFATELR
ncbi:MAG TPA: glutathione S-transferase family protein [Candidatus Nitrosopolaris sp.]|nr:glutathione S-transferase family protein [Candidatus Nitrosopolaris sp.]